MKLPEFYVDDIIKRALEEDINYIDITTDLLIPPDSTGAVQLIAKEDGILAGIDVALRTFNVLDSQIQTEALIKDGERLTKGVVIARVSGNTAAILKAERTALNLLQHMSGIATYTNRCVAAVSGTGTIISDTRKTLPGLRSLQKYAVLCGGGKNHRYNLSSAVLIKDNHIDATGGITESVRAVRERVGHMAMVEIEVRDLAALQEALDVGANVIMLDNMSVKAMTSAVKVTAGRALIEASGNVTIDNVREVAETGVNIISLGALTNSVHALDISLVWDAERS